MGSPARARLRGALTVAGVSTALVVGIGLVLVAMTLGRCDAFGGRCPSERPSLFGDDVFGMAAVGAALVVAVPILAARLSKGRLVVAAAAGLVAAVVVGSIARSSAYG